MAIQSEQLTLHGYSHTKVSIAPLPNYQKFLITLERNKDETYYCLSNVLDLHRLHILTSKILKIKVVSLGNPL